MIPAKATEPVAKSIPTPILRNGVKLKPIRRRPGYTTRSIKGRRTSNDTIPNKENDAVGSDIFSVIVKFM